MPQLLHIYDRKPLVLQLFNRLTMGYLAKDLQYETTVKHVIWRLEIMLTRGFQHISYAYSYYDWIFFDIL